MHDGERATECSGELKRTMVVFYHFSSINRCIMKHLNDIGISVLYKVSYQTYYEEFVNKKKKENPFNVD